MSPATPVIFTVATSATVGGSISDTATISGLVNPDGTGTITFTAYSDKDCTNDVFSSGSTPAFVTDNGDYVSDGSARTTPGTTSGSRASPGTATTKAPPPRVAMRARPPR